MDRKLTKDEEALVQRVVMELGHQSREYYDELSDHEKHLILEVLRQEAQQGKSDAGDLLWEMDYDRKPVGISQFITDPDYLGLDIIRNQDDENKKNGVYEMWYDVLCELFDPLKKYHELVVSSSIGTGKSSMASLAMVYKLYQMSCLRDPQNFYGLMPGHKIIYGVFTVFKYKARELGGDYIRKAVEGSPYFREVFPYNRNKAVDLEFPKSISLTYGASALSAIGLNLFSVLIDEAEFMKGATSESDKGQAYDLYTSTVRRMESRFMRQGNMPGIMIQISSKSSADSYLAERIRNNADDDKILVVEKTGWEVKPWRYKGDKFPVFTGDSYNDPRILTQEECDTAEDKTGIMMIPVEHRKPFEEDIYGALRDLANVATGSGNPLLPNRTYIYNAINEDRFHPFKMDEFHIGVDDDLVIADFLDMRKIVGTRRGSPTPRLNPTAPRYIHLDLAFSGDALGFCMGHIGSTRILEKADNQNPGLQREVVLPQIEIDMVMRVVPRKGSKIRFSAVRDFIVHLRQYGFNIAEVTADTFQSVDLLQQLTRMGFNTSNLSVDIAKTKDAAPYAYLRDAFLDGRISYYDYPILQAELVNLQRFEVVKDGKIKWKVDHPAKMNLGGQPVKGSKDVADALCGVIYQCMTKDMTQDNPAILRAPGASDVNPTGRNSQRNRHIRAVKQARLGLNLFDDYDG